MALLLVAVILTLPAWFCSTAGFGVGSGTAYLALYGVCVTYSRGGLALFVPAIVFHALSSPTGARSEMPLFALPSTQPCTRSRPLAPRSITVPVTGHAEAAWPSPT